jgi:hypothetical protein
MTLVPTFPVAPVMTMCTPGEVPHLVQPNRPTRTHEGWTDEARVQQLRRRR